MALARSGLAVALSGRNAGALADVRDEILSFGGRAIAAPLDVADAESTPEVIAQIESELGTITVAVFCAGMNVPDRHWGTLDMADFQQIVNTNLVAVARGTDAVLPGMRAAGGGQIVVISSWAGWTHARGAGVAYSASKTGLSALVETLNDHEGVHGIRGTHLCPGDVNTPFIDRRPVVPAAADRETMLSPDDVARAVLFVVESPAHVCINELVITPTDNRSYLRPPTPAP